jgi:BMFP domain-containing protein YqiC
MQNQNQLFEDLSRLMSSIGGTMAGAGREAEAKMKEKLREAVGGVDMVSREEFEAVKAMAAETKAELEALKASLAAGGQTPGDRAPGSKAPGDTPAKGSKIDIN